jgi:hypothetical protein
VVADEIGVWPGCAGDVVVKRTVEFVVEALSAEDIGVVVAEVGTDAEVSVELVPPLVMMDTVGFVAEVDAVAEVSVKLTPPLVEIDAAEVVGEIDPDVEVSDKLAPLLVCNDEVGLNDAVSKVAACEPD